MEKDFHYYLTYAFAKFAKCDQAEVIAYSCQFVDDNNEGQFSIDGSEMLFPDKIPMGGGHYYPIMTQSLSPKSFDIYIQKYVYVPFHFLPGDNTIEIKGRKNPLSTTPDSRNSRALVDAALKSRNPYRIGIALHTYADTWSHQNFTGLREDWNAVYPWYNVFKSIAPNIGHAEAGHAPDVISDTWTDHRINKRIDNRARALDASERIYSSLHAATGAGPLWSDIEKDMEAVINAPDYDSRIRMISDCLAGHGYDKIPNYSKDDWIDAALDRRGDRVIMQPDFEKSHWHRFHQAAKIHFASAADLIKNL